MTGQLAEKAAGMFQIFADAAGVGVPEFLKMMEAGKVTTYIVTKAGLAAGDWADKQGTLNEALQTSQAKQTLFNNSLKTMSSAILKGGLDSALADMFMALVPIVEVVGYGLTFIVKTFSKILNGYKAIYGYTEEHPIAAPFIVATSALVILLKYFGGWKMILVNALVSLYKVITGVGVLNKALLLTKVRLAAVWAAGAALLYLFTELDGFFKGEENNFLMTWYYTVRLIISELDVLFAKMKYNIFMFKQNPLGYFKETFAPEQQEPMSFKKAMTMGGIDWAKYLYNYIGDGIQNGFHSRVDAAQAVQQNVPTSIENKFFLNLGGLSLQDKQRLIGGETVQIPTPLLRPSVLEYGGLGTNR